eukprot:scaffold208158_cov22-Tisochrysis_lutea.AAC.2
MVYMSDHLIADTADTDVICVKISRHRCRWASLLADGVGACVNTGFSLGGHAFITWDSSSKLGRPAAFSLYNLWLDYFWPLGVRACLGQLMPCKLLPWHAPYVCLIVAPFTFLGVQ